MTEGDPPALLHSENWELAPSTRACPSPGQPPTKAGYHLNTQNLEEKIQPIVTPIQEKKGFKNLPKRPVSYFKDATLKSKKEWNKM